MKFYTHDNCACSPRLNLCTCVCFANFALQEVAAAALARYGDRMQEYSNDQASEQPISALEVDEASNVIFRPAAASGKKES